MFELWIRKWVLVRSVTYELNGITNKTGADILENAKLLISKYNYHPPADRRNVVRLPFLWLHEFCVAFQNFGSNLWSQMCYHANLALRQCAISFHENWNRSVEPKHQCMLRYLWSSNSRTTATRSQQLEIILKFIYEAFVCIITRRRGKWRDTTGVIPQREFSLASNHMGTIDGSISILTQYC